MTNLMKFIVFAFLVATVCSVPLRPESEALISEIEPKADSIKSEPISEERERAEALEAADKSEAEELKSEPKERAEELKTEDDSKAEELKTEDESKAEELKSSSEEKRERRESEQRAKAEELKVASKAEMLKADEIKAEELKTEAKAEEMKAEELKTEAKAEELKAKEKAEMLKAEEKRDRRESEERAEASKADERSEEEAQELRADKEKAEEKAEMLKAEEVKAEEKAEQLKAKEEAQEIKVEERAEELRSALKEKTEGEAEELRSEKDESKAEELKSSSEEEKRERRESEQREKAEAEELKSSEEKSEGEAEELRSEKDESKAEELKSSEEKSEGEAEELRSEKDESKAEELKSETKERAEELKAEEKKDKRHAEEKSEGEAQELKSSEDKTEGEAQEIKSEEKPEGETQEMKSEEKPEGEAQEMKSEEKPEGEAQEMKSQEEREKERIRREIEKAIEAEEAEALESSEPREKSRERRAEEAKSKAESLKKEEQMMMMAEQMMGEPTMEALVGQDPSILAQHNPCDVPEFKYYQPHPTEPSKYYQCDPWGTFVEKKCEQGLMWDRWELRCEKEDKIVNMTSVLPSTIRRLSDFNCTIAKFSCKNGGECVSHGTEFHCACVGNFTGDMCEVKVTDFDLYSEIMNGNFSIESYIRRIMKENVSLDLSYYEQYKEVLEPAVYERLIGYLSHYKNGLVRYDTLVNSLVEDVLGDIYPDADFLRNFNISQQSVITTIRLVPNLLSYARYSTERYQEVFVQYQRVLEQLWSFLNTTVPKLRTEAVHYTELTQFFLNGTFGKENWKVLNKTVSTRFGGRNFLNDTIGSDVVVKESIKEDFQSILERARVLCEKLAKFEKEVVVEWKKSHEFVYKTVPQTQLPGSEEFIALFEEIKEINMDIWCTLVSYGFWFITNIFTTAPRV